MHGVSTIIVVILILLIVIALVTMLWQFLSVLFTGVTETGEESTQVLINILSSCMDIESAYSNKIYLRNCGKGLITNDTLNVYMDDSRVNFTMTPTSISEGQIATISISLWGIRVGLHSLKITNPNTQLTETIEAFPENPIIDLRFDESSGFIAQDSSLYNNYGTLRNETQNCSYPPTAGCPAWVSGKWGNALKFDGIDDYVGINDKPIIRINQTIQVEAWINTSFIGPYNMSIANRFDEQENIDLGWLLYLTEQGKLRFYIGESTANWAYATGTTDLRNGKWHFVVGTYNKSIIQVFVDGKLEHYMPFTGDIWNGTAGSGYFGLNIGRRCSVCGATSSALFNGIIDEVKIYNETVDPFKAFYIKVK